MQYLLCLLICLLPVAVAAADTLPAVRLLVSNAAPFAGEETILTLEMRYRGRLPGRPTIRWGDTGDAVIEELPAPALRRDGKLLVESARRSLHFLESGRRTLTGGVEMNGRIHAAAPLSLRVRPLPEAGQPADFSGAVGRAELELRAEGRGTREIAVVLRGDAPLRSFPPPRLDPGGGRLLPLGEGFTGGAGGERERAFRYLFLPGEGRPGELSATLPLFDPREGRYRVLSDSLSAPSGPGLPLLLLLLLVPLAACGAWLFRRRRRHSLEGVLANLLGRPTPGLCRERMVDGLQRAGVCEDALRDLVRLWDAEDRERFSAAAPPSVQSPALRRTAARSLRKGVDKSRRIP